MTRWRILSARLPPYRGPTGETRALNFCNQMYVMGGGRTAPNPSNEVNIYDPVANTLVTGPAVRNCAAQLPDRYQWH